MGLLVTLLPTRRTGVDLGEPGRDAIIAVRVPTLQHTRQTHEFLAHDTCD